MNLRLVFLYSALFLLTACSHTDKPAAGTDISQILGDDFVGFGAVSKAGAVDPDNDYLHNTFIHNSSYLRIYNYVGDDLDFTDEAGFKWYVYDDGLSNLTGGQYNFRPMDGRGFRWSELKTEGGGGYKFDAIVFPHFHKYRNEVYTNQNPNENFLASDILMAHHVQLESEYGKKVSLHFWHVLSMVRVKVFLHKYNPVDNTGFGIGAIDSVVLPKMLTQFNYQFNKAVSSDQSPGVETTTEKRDDVTMHPLYDTVKFEGIEEDKDVHGHDCYVYSFAAIIPEQELTETEVILRLKLHTVDNQERVYVYTPSTGAANISVTAGAITDLHLIIKEDANKAFLVKTEVKPWTEASADMSLEKE